MLIAARSSSSLPASSSSIRIAVSAIRDGVAAAALRARHRWAAASRPQWVVAVAVAAVTAQVPVASASADRVRCSRPHARTAARPRWFRSGRPVASRSSATTASADAAPSFGPRHLTGAPAYCRGSFSHGVASSSTATRTLTTAAADRAVLPDLTVHEGAAALVWRTGDRTDGGQEIELGTGLHHVAGASLTLAATCLVSR